MKIKQIIISLLLAISFSYGDTKDDLIYMSTAMTNCANKDIVKYVTLLANINKHIDVDDKIEALELFDKYITKYCQDEAIRAKRVLDKYTKNQQMAIFSLLIARQMRNISNWFSIGDEDFSGIAKLILER